MTVGGWLTEMAVDPPTSIAHRPSVIVPMAGVIKALGREMNGRGRTHNQQCTIVMFCNPFCGPFLPFPSFLLTLQASQSGSHTQEFQSRMSQRMSEVSWPAGIPQIRLHLTDLDPEELAEEAKGWLLFVRVGGILRRHTSLYHDMSH